MIRGLKMSLTAIILLSGIMIASPVSVPVCAAHGAGAGEGLEAQGQGTAASLIAEGDLLYSRRADVQNVNKSLEVYAKALELDPGSSEACWKLARSHHWLGDKAQKKDEKLDLYQKGKGWAEKAVSVDPKCVDGYYWLGACIGSTGETRGILNSLFMVPDLRKQMDKVLELDPKYAAAHYVLGMLYRKVPGWPLSVGDMKKSLHHAKLAVEYGPDEIQHWLELAETQVALKDYAAARKTLNDLLAMTPNPEEPAEEQERIERAKKLLKDIGGK